MDAAHDDASTDAGSLGRGDAEAADSGVYDSGDGRPRPFALRATATDTRVIDTGTVAAPIELASYDLAVLVYDESASTFSSHEPAVTTAGEFHVEELPPGPRYIRFSPLAAAPEYFVTTSEVVDFGATLLGRVDRHAPAAGTALVLGATGLDAWQASSAMQLYSIGAGTSLFGIQASVTTGAPSPGDISLSNFSLDYATQPNAALIDGSKGDRAYLTQLVSRPAPTGAYLALTRFFALPSFSMVDGKVTNVSGAFGAPASSTIELDWKGSAFEGAMEPENPHASLVVSRVMGHAQLHSEAGIFESGTPLLLFYYEPPPANDGVTSLSFSNPFPSPWEVIVVGSAMYSRAYAAPGATPAGITCSIMSAQTATETLALAPIVGAVRNPVIAGKNALTDVHGVGTSPVVSFDGPSVGAPNGYEISFLRILNVSGSTRFAFAGRITTVNRSLVVPPGILEVGQHYVMVIAALARGGRNLEQTPRRLAYPQGHADVLSGHISP